MIPLRSALRPALAAALTAAMLATFAPAAHATGPDDPNYTDIVINEVTSDNAGTVDFAPNPSIGDAVELYNAGSHDVDLAGWTQIDSGAASAATDFSAGLYVDGSLSTVIPAGHYGVFQSTKGLGSGGDAVKVYTQNGTLVDSIAYTAGQAGVDETINADHAYHALAACPDGSDTFKEVPASTFGATNGTCAGGVDPLTGGETGTDPEAPCDTEDSGTDPGIIPSGAVAWPGDATPTTIDDQCAWVTSLSGQDLSGLAFDPGDPDVLYAVKNKSHVYRLVRSDGGWAKDTTNGWATGKDIRFPGGSGQPDSEGLTVGPDGSLYITTERDNAASGVPLDSILKFDPTSSDTTLVASDQWVLTDDLGFTAADANLGFEGVAYVPDGFLTSAGFRTDAGALYRPADYPAKVAGGVFFAAVEKTGHLRAYVLNSDHTFARVADVDTGMAGVMDDSFDPDLGRIWAHCDNTCGNATAVLGIDASGHFGVDRYYKTPAGLPNYNLEGFAVAPASTATAGTREVLWTDDGDRFGHSLWSGTIDVTLDLPAFALHTHRPTISGSARVGRRLSAHVTPWGPGTVRLGYTWLADGHPIAGATGSSLRLEPAQVGRRITVRVMGTRVGYATATATSPASSQVLPGRITTKRPTIRGGVRVGHRLSAHPGAWKAAGSRVGYHYTWFANGRAIHGATKQRLHLTHALRGKRITVRVVARAKGYAKASRISTPTRRVR